MSQEFLGRLGDVSIGIAPVDLSSGASTGKRVSLKHAAGVTVIFKKGAGTAGDDPVLTFKQHTAASGGTTSNLAVVDHYYSKSATTLAGSETWTRVAQAAAATATLTGEAAKQGIYVFEIQGTALADGYKYFSVDIADVGNNAQLGTVEYVLHDLAVARTPANLIAPLS